MSRHVLLNNVDHRDLRVDTRRSRALGDDVMCAATFPAEFRELQSCYPIVFRRDGSGAMQPVALLGLRQGENLFLKEDGWDGACLPLSIERQPFLIGQGADGPMVHIDLDSPRVSRDRGEPLFLDHGGTTPYLERVTSVLLALHDGVRSVPAFVEALQRHALLEPFVLDIRLRDGSQARLAGFHTIAEERLRAIDGPALEELHMSGHLEPLYMAVASLGQLRNLIERLNRRIAVHG